MDIQIVKYINIIDDLPIPSCCAVIFASVGTILISNY